MSEIKKNNINSLDCLISQINETAGSIQRERGSLFEKLVLAYLKNEPTYKQLYSNVWLLNDVPEEFGIPKKDTGVDIVAQQRNGELVAIQAKFYKDKIGKAEINSFVADLGKHYYQRGMIVSTVDDWNENALETVSYNEKGIEIIGLSDLRHSQIDWEEFSFERPENVRIKSRKKPRFYQKMALENALKYFENNNRGQLIMAPGTGKTFTSLKITEALAKNKQRQFKVLYLVPSIQLLTQTLRCWNNDTVLNITSMAVTSDRDASRGDDGTEDIKATDIGYPATTSTNKLLNNWKNIQKMNQKDDLLVVFSTYQSIDVIGDAQKRGFPEFDLIISDEAHRTTGAYEKNKGSNIFSKVHEDHFVKGEKRLYQTATPKMYGEDAKKNAKEKSVVISSMDDESIYGEVFYRMGFGQAVSYGILTDYKVMVLAIDEAAIQKDMQQALSDPENGLNIDDIGRIVGIWNGMMRRNGYKNPIKNSAYDGAPLERAIAFTRTISDSQKVAQQFEEVVNEYIGYEEEKNTTSLSMRHADGSMNSLQKGNVLDWLANPNKPRGEARIVSNVRFLTEGIDVPSLDAVIFLAPKKSQVDIVQAVGRIMRKYEGKDYGYIILPVVIPTDETPETILDNNKNYEAVWQIINALRSVDERFEAMVDKINIAKPKQLKVIGVGSAPKEANEKDTSNDTTQKEPIQTELNFEWDKFESSIYGKIVQKVGDRKYLENWSTDVAKIAQRQINWIKNKLEDRHHPISGEFKKFVFSLQHNINESIDEAQAAEMLSQHLITKPVFEALFDQYSFVNNNPVSLAMEKIVKELENAGFAKEQENLEPLYESVRMRAEGVERSEDKQKIIVTLYDKFFSTAFKATTDRLGIVFTPIEVVDFIIKSVDDVLQKHFEKTLSSKGVHVLDPFTGTGTFIVRTLTYLKDKMDEGGISLADITSKFMKELHANEIVLLSYYIAAINIEATFDDIHDNEVEYEPFEGIVLTDTFESTENESSLNDIYFGMNDKRLKRQQDSPITAIIGNPPYSVGQNSANDDNRNQMYPKLDERIRKTYVETSKVSNPGSIYDSYIKAIRWSSDRIKDKGIIAFVSNGQFIDSQSADGLRKSLYEEFNHLYIFNLRGDQRTKGEMSRREGGKIFGSGSRTPIAISILVKDGSDAHELHYHDIGDYLSRDEKLEVLSKTTSVKDIAWKNIVPDINNDWINQRDEIYLDYPAMDKDIFEMNTLGISTNRDNWIIGFNKKSIENNMSNMIKNYNHERVAIQNNEKINMSEKFIKWSDTLLRRAKRNEELVFNRENIRMYQYRPFTKKYLYYDRKLIDRARAFGDFNENNLVISTSGLGSKNEFSLLISNEIPDYGLTGATKAWLQYKPQDEEDLINFENESTIKSSYTSYLGLDSNDAFYYIYGVLHSTEYRKIYKNDLQKSLPRIPLLENKYKYVEIGKKLAELHLNYEQQPSLPEIEIQITASSPDYRVEKMKHKKIRDENGKLMNDNSTIIYNNTITINNIPQKAYEYAVNGRSAIEWIIDQYRVKKDKKTGITDDPNEYSNDPKYIFNLVLSIITVSMRTLELTNQLPNFKVVDN